MPVGTEGAVQCHGVPPNTDVIYSVIVLNHYIWEKTMVGVNNRLLQNNNKHVL